MASMSQLPPEVLTIIARAVVEFVDEPRPPALHQSLANLTSLAAVSKIWNAVVSPILYRQAIIQDIGYIGRTGASWRALCNVPPEMKTKLKATMTMNDHETEGEEHHDHQPKDDDENRPWRECHLMTAASAGNVALLQRLSSFIPKAFPNMSATSLLSAGFRVPWKCLNLYNYEDHDWSNEDEGLPEATLLHAAAARGHIGAVEWLLNRGVEVNADAHLGCICPAFIPITQCDATPLFLAIAWRHIEVAKVLIQNGAIWDRCFTRTEDVTALHLIAAHGMEELVYWLVAALDESMRHTELGKTVASNGPHHDWPDEMGLWTLHHAIGRAFSFKMCNSSAEEMRRAEDHVRRLITGLCRLGAVRRTMDPARWRRRVSLELERMKLKATSNPSGDIHIDAADKEWLEQIEWWHGQDRGLTDRDITAEPEASMLSYYDASETDRMYKVVLEVLNWEDD